MSNGSKIKCKCTFKVEEVVVALLQLDVAFSLAFVFGLHLTSLGQHCCRDAGWSILYTTTHCTTLSEQYSDVRISNLVVTLDWLRHVQTIDDVLHFAAFLLRFCALGEQVVARLST